MVYGIRYYRLRNGILGDASSCHRMLIEGYPKSIGNGSMSFGTVYLCYIGRDGDELRSTSDGRVMIISSQSSF